MAEPTVPLSERVEYASPGWLAEVERFLNARAHMFSDQPRSLSMRLDNPPPHLWDDANGSFGYTMRIASGSVVVEPRPDATADGFERGDYNAILPLLGTVFDEDIEASDRKDRELRMLVANGYAPSEGKPLDDPALGQAFFDMHNHMARRTVNNPDVLHRAKHLGLEQNLADLDDTGYTVLENAFSAEFADELRAEAQRNHDAAPPDTGFRATMLLRRGRLWEQAVIHPWVLTLAEYLLGRGCLIYQSDTIIKGPGLDTHPGLHADYGASRVAEPFPDYCLEATAVWAIDDFDADAGPTVIVPGSFKKRRQVPPGTTREDAVTIEMQKGSIAFWHGATWHGAMPRRAPGTRTSLHNAYCRYFMRPLERYDDIDQAIVDRNPPVFSTLCGLDDPFGRSGDTGADFERMRYTASAGYGRTALR
ncbi:MAG: phytanoyl-CoA dioxygenase family protein [Gammaproteobacteria bacterium]|nr:phytanoyl-CoA dioxygenase family protein [Gammaproteobacteria bacterium]